MPHVVNELSFFKKIRTHSGKLINVLSSENIKIISKPSRVARDGIRSGSYVALFNRIRAQTVSTRYLCASSDDRYDLEARNDHWDAFVIWLADDPRLTGSSSSVGPSSPLQEERLGSCKLQYIEAAGSSKLVGQKPVCVLLPESSVAQKPPASPNAAGWGGEDAEVRGLCYNDLVVLEHVNTGMRTVPFVLRRTEGADKVVTDGDKDGEDAPRGQVKRGELISQLHKIALEIQGEPGVYMQVNEEDGVGVTTVTAGAARGGGRMNNKRKREILQKGKDGFFRESVHDSSLWTIVSVEYTESTFYIPPAVPSQPQIPTTTPQVFDIHPTADGTLTLSVAHFPPNLEVFFGPIHADSTIHQPAESSVVVQIPRVDPATAEELVQFERQCCAASAQRAGRNEMEIIHFAASAEGVTGVTVPILLVGDDVIYRTGYYHRFCFEFI
ncbi:beta-trefoil DNA-binding domain-containing protein [Cladochytrium replicatum]|nr:beta-trefoil DNA-binding domain-containing protein [Cladochytrium replicatum]